MDKIKQIELGSWLSASKQCEVVRPLTDQELHFYEETNGVFHEAQNRLQLFLILERNYQAWTDYLKSLLSTNPPKGDQLLNLNQLMLNFLTTAYAIQEHFKASFQKRFRKDEKQLARHKDFFDKLCDTFWAVAFFLISGTMFSMSNFR